VISEIELSKLRKTFAEICERYSLYKFNDQSIYIKHFRVSDDLNIDFYYSSKYNDLLKKGIFTEKDKLSYLIKNNLWDKSNEDKIKVTHETLVDLYRNKCKVYRFADIEHYKKEIKTNENYLNNLIIDKAILMGETCETLARKSTDLLLIQQSFYKNKECTELLYSEKEFADLNSDQVDELFSLYNICINDVSEINIKKIVTQGFFNQIFYLSSSSTDFFGQCLTQLSHYQVKLLTWANYFKTIFQNNDIPDSIIDNPEEIENWFNGKRNIENVINSNADSEGNVSLVGVSKKEMKFYGIDNPAGEAQQQKITKELAKSSNGELSLEQSIELGLI